MKKLSVLFILFFFIALSSQAQSNDLVVEGTGNNLYLKYKVQSGDNFYSVGRNFNVAPQYLGSYNQVSIDNGLKVGQEIRIPLTNLNFTKELFKSSSEALVPVYHIIQPSETLFRLGNNFGESVPLASIREWNGMQNDNVKSGEAYIIGFLKVDKSESGLANRDFTQNMATVARSDDSAAPAEVKQDKPAPVVKQATATEGNRKTNEGFFKPDYVQQSSDGQLTSLNGTASVFKSTSGWQDGKYYCFTDDVKPGNIIKISGTDGSKVIYAKVLDGIPDIQQNVGLKLVLSNSAAEALGINDTRFEARMEFYK